MKFLLHLSLGSKAVAYPPDGLDKGVTEGFDLAAEAADVDVYGAGAAEVVVAPDPVEDGLPVEGLAPVLGQEAQELELLVGQVYLPPGHEDLVVGQVHDHVAQFEHVAGVHPGAAPEVVAEAGLHLGGGGRDGDKVVNAQGGVVVGELLGPEDGDGEEGGLAAVLGLAQEAAQGYLFPASPQVQQHQVGLGQGRGLPRAGGGGLVPLPLQGLGQD